MAGTWEPWAVDNPPLLARYVKPSEHLDLGVDLVALRQERNYQAIARAIYNAFCQPELGYDYNLTNSDSRVQEIRKPTAILKDSHVGTCLDLALLFAGECLGRGLCAVVVSIHGHAFVAVASTSGLDSKVGAGRLKFQNGVIENAKDYLALVEDHGFVPIECTGFVKSSPPSTPPEGQFEGISRNNAGFLSFEDAVKVGKRHLEKPDAFKFAIDVEYLHGIETYKPFEAESPAIQEIQKGIRTLLEGFRTNPNDVRVNAPPAARNKLFGRDAALHITENALRNHETVLVYGMGGMGKTAVALETAKRLHNAKFFADGIVWISDIDHASTTAICDAVARSLGNEDLPKLNPDNPSQRQQKLEGTRQLLSSHNLVLILDDLALPDVAHEFLAVCLPEGMGALLTSRRTDLDAQTDMRLDVLEREDAKKLFLERSKQSAPDNRLELIVNDICAVLEDHPLALVIAAGRVRAEGMTTVRLLERLQDTKNRLLTVAPSDASNKDRNVRVSIQVSFDDLTNEQTRVFLMLSACFAETTGLEFLSDVCRLPQLECEDRLGELVQRSLVAREDQRFGLHALVRDFGRDKLGEHLEAGQNAVVATAVGYAERYNQITKEHLDCLDAERVNLLESIAHACQQDGLEELVFDLAHAVEDYLAVRGYWNEGILVGQMAIFLAKSVNDLSTLAVFMYNTAHALANQRKIEEAKSLGDQSLEIFRGLGDQFGVAGLLLHLGNIAYLQDDYDSARDYYYQSLDIFWKLGNQSGIANLLQQFGMIASNQGNYDSARDYYNQSLKIFQELGDQSRIAGSLHQLGNIALLQGNYDSARGYCEQSLKIARELGNQSGIAGSLHQLGIIAQDQGDYVTARDYYNQSLEISRRLEYQSGIVGSLHQLGIIAQDQKDYDSARDYHEQSLKIKWKIGDKSGIAGSLHQLGIIAQDQRDYDSARDYYEKSLKIAREIGDKSVIASSLHQFGMIADHQVDFDSARDYYNQSLEIQRKLGNQFSVAKSLYELGMTAQDQGDYDSARDYYDQSLEIRQELGDQSGIASSLHKLGRIAQDQGNYDSARGYYSQSLEIRQELGDQSGIAGSLHQLGIIADDQGDYDSARGYYEQSLKIFRELEDQFGIANSLHQFGNIAYFQGDYDSARGYYEESLKIARKLGDQSLIAKSLHQFGMIADDQGDYDSARGYYEQSLEILRKLGDQSGISGSLHQLGNIALLQGNYIAARGYYDQSLEIRRKLRDQSGIAKSLYQLGMIADDQGDYDSARGYYEQSLKIAREIGDQSGIANSLHQLGNIAYFQADYDSARGYYDQSLAIKRKLGNQSGIAISLGQFGRLAEIEGRREDACNHYKEALEIFERLKSPNANFARRSLERLGCT